MSNLSITDYAKTMKVTCYAFLVLNHIITPLLFIQTLQQFCQYANTLTMLYKHAKNADVKKHLFFYSFPLI